MQRPELQILINDVEAYGISGMYNAFFFDAAKVGCIRASNVKSFLFISETRNNGYGIFEILQDEDDPLKAFLPDN